jgi:hypothetical protein
MEAAVVRVHGQFLGCVIENGNHQVEFVFAPASLALGKWLSGLAFLGMSVCLLAMVLSMPPSFRNLPDRSGCSGSAGCSTFAGDLSSLQPLRGADK